MVKQRIAAFIVVVFLAFLPAVANAQFANEARLQASDVSGGEWFGGAVSISGDTAIAGAWGDDDNGSSSGSAYVFVRDLLTGAWSEQQKLVAADGVAFDIFGLSVSISGDTAIVGATGDDDKGSASGSAYVFVRDSGGVWTEQEKLVASDGAAKDSLGRSVSVSGDTAIIGADMDDEKGTNSGSAYVFVRNSGGVWTEQQKLLASDGVADDAFGRSVSISGDTAIVGAYWDDDNGTKSGSAYVFVRGTGTSVWIQQQKLLASDGFIGHFFGGSVSVSGDTAIVGAEGNDAGFNNSGSAYIFVRDSGGVWTEQQQLLASDRGGDDAFGRSVSISDDVAIVGARGFAYVFVRDSGGVWTEQKPKLLAFGGGAASGRFGWSVSISGDRAVVGADNGNNAIGLGSAYVYASSGVTAPDITVTDSVAPNTDLQIPFGDITEQISADQTVTISNDGSADLTLGTIAETDALDPPFSIPTDNCSGQTLTPAASCTLTVRFSPLSIGPFSDSFDIPSDDPDENPVTVSVSGSGIGVTAPNITVTDAVVPVDDLQIPFGNVTEMATADQVVTVTNDGNADLLIYDVAMANPLAAPFSVQNDDCSNQTLTPASSCTFTVWFSPTAGGAFTDTLDIPSNDADENPVTVGVSGTGTPTPVPDIAVTDAIAPADDQQIPFPDLTVGNSNNQTLTIANDGNADLVIGTIAQADVLVAPFSVVNDNCSGQMVAVAANCTIDVRFAPTAAGTSNDSFDIPSNDPDENPLTVSVSGTGLVAAVNNPPSSPSLVSPADGQQGLSTTVTLKWKPSTDPDGDAVTYDVYSCTDPDPANACTRLTEVSLLSIPPNAPLSNTLDNGIYYAGLGLGGGIMILGFTFAGGVRSRKQTALLIVVIALTAFLASCHGGGNTKSYVVSGLSADTTYYWTVIAKDGNGGETPSAVWSYSTQ